MKKLWKVYYDAPRKRTKTQVAQNYSAVVSGCVHVAADTAQEAMLLTENMVPQGTLIREVKLIDLKVLVAA